MDVKEHDDRRSPLLRFVCLAVLSFVLQCGRAQEVCKLSYLDGLNGEHVNKIYRDSYGIVWIGTNRGVSVYNGHVLVNVQPADGTQYAVNDIAEDEAGQLLLATDGGVYAVDFAMLGSHRVMPEIQQASAFCRAGGMFYVGGQQGIYECDGQGRTRRFGIENYVISKGNRVVDMCCAGDRTTSDALWIATAEKVVRFNCRSHQIETFSLKPYLRGGRITCLQEAAGRICVGTSGNGLFYLHPRTRVVSRSNAAGTTYVRDLNIDRKGELYVSGNLSYVIDVSRDSLVVLLNGTDDKWGTTGGSYTFWHDDEFGINWLGFFVEGFSHEFFHRRHLQTYAFDTLDTDGLDVRSFHRHADAMMIGTRGGLYYVDERQLRLRYWSADELGSHVVTDVCWFAGRFVVSTFDGGVRTFDPVSMQLSQPLPDLQGNFSRLVCSPDSSLLYATGSQGLYVLGRDMQLVQHFDHHNSELPDEYLAEIFFDDTGKGWISTFSRLCMLDVEKGQIIAHGFPENFINDIGLLSFNRSIDGDVLAFVNATVYKVHPDLSGFREINLSEILGAGAINFVFAADNRYFVGTTLGLFVFDEQFQNYVHYSESDGLPSLEFNKQQVQLTDDGKLWMGNYNGVVMIDPDSTKQADVVPGHVIADRMMIDFRMVESARLFELVRHPSLRVRWNFGQEPLDVAPLLLNYAKVSGRFYEWTIDDGPFRSCREGQLIAVRDLSLGKHRLVMRLAGHPETASVITIRVVPSALFWFECLFVLLLFVALWSVSALIRRSRRYRQLQHRKHQLEYQLVAQEAVRRHELQQQREREAYEQIQMEARQKRTSGKEYRELQRKVKEYVELEHPYRNPSFRLSDLAKVVGSSPTMISLMLNQNLNTNFYDFINRYRLDEFKMRLSEGKSNGLGIIAIAERCGFRRSTFFATFKKFEGCTPSEYLERIRKKEK